MARQAISKKNQKTFIMLGGAVIVVVLILYFGVIRSPGSEPSLFETERRSSKVPDLNTALLDQAVLGEFDVWSSLPVEVGPTGKINPFSQ